MAPKEHTQMKLSVPDEIATLIRGCHPRLKSKIREGLRRILAETESGEFLKDALTGLQSYRISKFRIIYRGSFLHLIEIVGIGPRKKIYEETYRIIKKESEQYHAGRVL